MKCWRSGAGGLAKLGMRAERITPSESCMTTLKNIRKQWNSTKSFCKFAKALTIAMARL